MKYASYLLVYYYYHYKCKDAKYEDANWIGCPECYKWTCDLPSSKRGMIYIAIILKKEAIYTAVTVHSDLYGGQTVAVSVQRASCLNKTESKEG